MSGFGQTSRVRPLLDAARRGGVDVGELLLYGLNEAGEAAFTERLRISDRATLRGIAAERLHNWHAVEVWEGPMCVVRLRREPVRPA